VERAVEAAFTAHESHREPSFEFKQPGPSSWRHAQEWAQLAVDRPDGTPLPPYTEELDPPPATDHVSYALGVALGRFHADGSGILDPRASTSTSTLAHALPHGLLFLDGTLTADEPGDSLSHPACAPLRAAWHAHRAAIAPKLTLRDYLSDKLFAVHKSMYDNRPIHWPLSSDKKTFVVWLNIHRMDRSTLSNALVLLVTRRGELAGLAEDSLAARGAGDAKHKRDADERYAQLDKALKELDRFIDTLRQLDTRGPLPASPDDQKGTPKREVDAKYDPDLDDGVMINSAALWPVLEPQWKDPKKWWKELASASGKKDYDWSHLAMRYWPARVDKKCRLDPSLGVAHGCFWAYHPARAYAWELRLQDEISPDFRIIEADHEAHRQRFITEHPADAIAAIDKEATRRARKRKAPIATLTLLDPGLWTTNPAALYDLELQRSEKQGAELRIEAPDEPQARQLFESQNPNRAAHRRRLLSDLTPATLDLGDDDTGTESEEDDSEPDSE